MSKRKTPSEQQRVKFEGQEPTFYAMIPKMAIMDLTPYELALYCNYKQTASENGECTKSTATLATETHMSVSKVKLTRKSLEDKGYIKIERHTDPSGIENQTMTVTIVNVWGKNHERYSRQEVTTPSYVVTTPQSQGDGEGVTTKPQRITIQEEPDKKVESAPAPVAQEPTTSHLPANAINFDAFKTVTPAMNDTIAFMNAQKYMQAFEAAFPANAPVKLPNSHTNRETALFLLKAGYNPDDVTELVKQKIAEGRTAYKFAWLQTDMSEFLQAREKKKPNPPKLTYIVAPPPDDDDYVTETKSA